MRGLSAGNVATQSGGSINGSRRAIYLDEQSVSCRPQPGCVRSRSRGIEVLRGPTDAVRRRSSRRRHPLYHEQAEAQQDRGEAFLEVTARPGR